MKVPALLVTPDALNSDSVTDVGKVPGPGCKSTVMFAGMLPLRVAPELLEHDPNEPYAHLLVGRALQRKGQGEEAQPHLRLAELLGGYRV